MKTPISSRRSPLGSCLLALVMAAMGGGQALGQIRVTPLDPTDSADHLSVRVPAPEGARVTLQVRTALAGGAWEAAADPVIASAQGAVEFLVPKGTGQPQTSFYRALTESFVVRVVDDGKKYSISTGGGVPLATLLDRVRRVTGLEVFPTDALADPVGTMVPAFSVESESLEEALAKAGVRVRVVPPLDETSPAFGRAPLRTSTPPLAPAPTGRGLPDDPVISDSTLPRFPEPRPGTPPPVDNMVSVSTGTALPDGGSPTDTPADPEPGRHIRMQVELGMDGSMRLVRAVECRGDARKPAPEGGLGEDDYVMVFRSASARLEPANIYAIATFHEPFLEHRYGVPRNESPHTYSATAVLSAAMPVLPEDVDLGAVQVEVLKVTGELEEGPLTATSFLRQIRQMSEVGVLEGAEIQRLRTVAGRGRVASPAADLPAPRLTAVAESGPRSKKVNLVFMGDGFADTPADQKRFDDWVNAAVLNGTFGSGTPLAVRTAFNLYKINTYSEESGVTRVNGAGVPIPGQKRKTALGMQYSGDWDRCWIEGSLASPISSSLIHGVLDDLVPEWDKVVIVVNVMDKGGCSKGSAGMVFVTLIEDVGMAIGSNSPTLYHELGHALGDLGDEYRCVKGEDGCKKYGGLEPTRKNLTKRTERSEIKWRTWIPWWRPVPTAKKDVSDEVLDVGLFAGATRSGSQYYTGIYRPSFSGVMDDNVDGLNPVGEARFRAGAAPYLDNVLQTAVSGDFDNDGLLDLFHVDGRVATFYGPGSRFLGPPDPHTGSAPRSTSRVLYPRWRQAGPLRNAKGLTWVFSAHDQVFPGDIDGDGRDDLYVVNQKDWGKFYVAMLRSQSAGFGFEPVRIFQSDLPGWKLVATDQFRTGDFDGDGKTDLAVFNGLHWDNPHFALFRSTGTNLTSVQHYIQTLPGAFTMSKNDRFETGDLNGDGRTDLMVYNKEDWSDVVMGLFLGSASGLNGTRQYGYSTGSLKMPDGGRWNLRAGDRYLLADLDGDRKKELVLINSQDWAKRYFVAFKLSGNDLGFFRIHENSVGGWNLSPHDLHRVADLDSDGLDDLFVVNTEDFNGPYIGLWLSKGGGTFASHAQKAPIGFFDLQPGTSFHVGNYGGTGGFADLYAIRGNHVWMLRGEGKSFTAETYYPGWIQNQRYHLLGYW